MLITLHKNARTTPAIRAEIAASSESTRALAKRFGVSELTIAKWRKRASVNDLPHTPHRLQTTLSPAQEAIVVELRKSLLLPLDDLVAVTKEFICPKASRSGLDRSLRRHGLSNLHKLKPIQPKSPHKPFKSYVPGYLHVDIKYLPQMADETAGSYLLVAIDRATRWVFVQIMPSKSAANARKFLKTLHKACSIKIKHILTDNGKEFTDRLFASRARVPTGEHEFDKLCAELGIEYRLTKPRTPQTNGMVERFNGRISDVLQSHHFVSGEDLAQTLYRYVLLYNQQLPQSTLGSKTPLDAMQRWYESHPHLFVKRPCNLAGGDKYKIIMKVIHIISGLADGGAEAVLYRLCKHDQANHHYVVSLSGAGKYGAMLAALGVSVTTLNMQPGRPSPLAFIRLVRLLRRKKPDVVQTWMYHGDLFGGLAARVAGIRSVVWGIHHTTLETGKSKKTTIWIAKLLAKLSWWLPVKIIACAQRAIDVHEALGYDRIKMRFIPNGYDLADFKPGLDPQGELRASLVSDRTIPLIGTVGRFDPQKDHANLLDALVMLRNRGSVFRCVLVGTGLDSSNTQIVELISQRGLADHVQLLGRRNDIPSIMNVLDLHVLPSCYGEAFPNVVCEAMACGTPCVVTDVGDAAYIVGDTGWVVPPRDASSLAEAIASALRGVMNAEQCSYRSSRVRFRIKEHFSIERMVGSYTAVWNKLN